MLVNRDFCQTNLLIEKGCHNSLTAFSFNLTLLSTLNIFIQA